MNTRLSILALLAAACGLLTGCGASPLQRSIGDGGLRKITMAPREAHLESIEVVDERPASELDALKPEAKYVIPPFWFSRAGHQRAEARLYSADVRAELAATVKQTFDKSHLFSPGDHESGVRLTIKLKQLHGISYNATEMAANYTRVTQFACYGYAAAEVVLSDAANKPLATRQVVGMFLPDPSIMSASMTDALTLVAVKAASDLARNVVRTVEPMLAAYPASTEVQSDTSKVFFLARATAEAPFLEIAGIDYESGEITSDVVVRRRMEAYGALDEWVVDPYFGGKARLTPEEYDALIEKLRKKYDVRYVSDVRTAHFLGVLAPPPPPPKKKPRRGAAKK
jgi:hypothetical protein